MEFSVFLVGQAVIYPAKRLCNGAKNPSHKKGATTHLARDHLPRLCSKCVVKVCSTLVLPSAYLKRIARTVCSECVLLSGVIPP